MWLTYLWVFIVLAGVSLAIEIHLVSPDPIEIGQPMSVTCSLATLGGINKIKDLLPKIGIKRTVTKINLHRTVASRIPNVFEMLNVVKYSRTYQIISPDLPKGVTEDSITMEGVTPLDNNAERIRVTMNVATALADHHVNSYSCDIYYISNTTDDHGQLQVGAMRYTQNPTAKFKESSMARPDPVIIGQPMTVVCSPEAVGYLFAVNLEIVILHLAMERDGAFTRLFTYDTATNQTLWNNTFNLIGIDADSFSAGDNGQLYIMMQVATAFIEHIARYKCEFGLKLQNNRMTYAEFLFNATSECQDFKFDFNCTKTCHCGNISEVCDKETGACLTGCLPGWRGADCQQPDCSHKDYCGIHICQELRHDYNCSCLAGYENSDPQHCEDINECTEGDVCDTHTCKNTDGGFNCTCNGESYENKNQQLCWKIISIDPENNEFNPWFLLQDIKVLIAIQTLCAAIIGFFVVTALLCARTVGLAAHRFVTTEPCVLETYVCPFNSPVSINEDGNSQGNSEVFTTDDKISGEQIDGDKSVESDNRRDSGKSRETIDSDKSIKSDNRRDSGKSRETIDSDKSIKSDNRPDSGKSRETIDSDKSVNSGNSGKSGESSETVDSGKSVQSDYSGDSKKSRETTDSDETL